MQLGRWHMAARTGLIVSAALASGLAIKVAEGAVPKPASPLSLRLAVHSYGVDGPSTVRRSRAGYDLGAAFSVQDFLRAETNLLLLPDTTKASGLVDIRQDFYSLSLGLAAYYTYLFRFTGGLGPVLAWARTTTEVDGVSYPTTSEVTLGGYGRLGIEYAFSPRFELDGGLMYLRRMKGARTDRSFYLGLRYYL